MNVVTTIKWLSLFLLTAILLYTGCSSAQWENRPTKALDGTATTLSRSGYLVREPRQALLARKSKTFSNRYGHQVVVYNNQLWLIGGYDDSDNYHNDVWSSTDGSNWMQQTNAAPFSPRDGHQVVVYKSPGARVEQLWLIGGYDKDGNYKNDIWSSSDGRNWVQQIDHPFSPRHEHQIVVYKNQLWMIGGWSGGSKNDVWFSSDGSNWVQQTNAALFPPRSDHQIVVYKNRLWVIGGSSSDGAKNDVWVSSDGINWVQQETGENIFSPRYGHQIVVHKNQLWMIGGYDGNRKNDIWTSDDGRNWVQQTDAASFSPRRGHQVVVFNNLLWLIGGYDGRLKTNDVWSSSDGRDWVQQSAPPFSPR